MWRAEKLEHVRPHPGPLLQGEGDKVSAFCRRPVAGEMPAFPRIKNHAKGCPLLGERKQVREDVKQTHDNRQTPLLRQLIIAQPFKAGHGQATNTSPVRDERSVLPSLTGLVKYPNPKPSHEWLGYFHGNGRDARCAARGPNRDAAANRRRARWPWADTLKRLADGFGSWQTSGDWKIHPPNISCGG